MAQTVKRLPTMRETRVRSLGGEDALEKEMATHCSVLAWRIPGTEEPGGLPSLGWHSVLHFNTDLGLLQARILDWVAISSSRGSSQPRDLTRVSRIVGRRFTV